MLFVVVCLSVVCVGLERTATERKAEVADIGTFLCLFALFAFFCLFVFVVCFVLFVSFAFDCVMISVIGLRGCCVRDVVWKIFLPTLHANSKSLRVQNGWVKGSGSGVNSKGVFSNKTLAFMTHQESSSDHKSKRIHFMPCPIVMTSLSTSPFRLFTRMNTSTPRNGDRKRGETKGYHRVWLLLPLPLSSSSRPTRPQRLCCLLSSLQLFTHMNTRTNTTTHRDRATHH